MKLLSLSLLLAFTLPIVAADEPKPAPGPKEVITYYDRNGDGKADMEKHHFVGAADMDWELLDEDYNGRYDKKTVFGFAVISTKVDLPVPANVKLEKKPQ